VLQEHAFVTFQGGRFGRAVQRGNLLEAETNARELGRLNLRDALSLLVSSRRRILRASSLPPFLARAVRSGGSWLLRDSLPTKPETTAVCVGVGVCRMDKDSVRVLHDLDVPKAPQHAPVLALRV